MDSLLDNLYLLYTKLENIKRENFVRSLAKHQIHQYFHLQNFVLYGIHIQYGYSYYQVIHMQCYSKYMEVHVYVLKYVYVLDFNDVKLKAIQV